MCHYPTYYSVPANASCLSLAHCIKICVKSVNIRYADIDGHHPCFIHVDGQILMGGGSSQWTQLKHLILWKEKLVAPVAIKAAAGEESVEGTSGVLGMINIDAYPVNMSEDFCKHSVFSMTPMQLRQV
jgi:hypothetical protein